MCARARACVWGGAETYIDSVHRTLFIDVQKILFLALTCSMAEADMLFIDVVARCYLCKYCKSADTALRGIGIGIGPLLVDSTQGRTWVSEKTAVF